MEIRNLGLKYPGKADYKVDLSLGCIRNGVRDSDVLTAINASWRTVRFTI